MNVHEKIRKLVSSGPSHEGRIDRLRSYVQLGASFPARREGRRSRSTRLIVPLSHGRLLARARARTALALLALLALLSATGCAAPLTCPAKGGAPWTEASSAHFVLRTDVEPREAHAMLEQFERLWTVLAYVTKRPPVTEPKIDIVRFDRRRDMAEITGRDSNAVGYFAQELPGDLLEPQPTVVFHGLDLADEDRETFLHELTHRFLRERFSSLPTWLNEGLAKYYETLRVDAGRVVLGETGGLDFSDRSFWWSSWRGTSETTQVPAFKAPTVEHLVSADWSTFHSVLTGARPTNEDQERELANYAAAWKLVHYFLDGPDAGDRARFALFFAALEQGKRAKETFLEVFGADLPRLEQSFHRYLTQPRVSRRIAEYPSETTAAPPVERSMSDAEVHLLWARLLPWKEGSMDRVRRELDEAMASDPGSPEVRYRRGLFWWWSKRLDEASRDFDVSLAARPDDPRYLLAQLAWYESRNKAGGSVPMDLVEHLARTATSAEQLRAAAGYMALHGRTEEGFRLIERALAVDPLSWRCQATRAEMLARVGRFDEALATVERALALLAEGESTKVIIDVRRTIELARVAANPPQRGTPP